MQLSVSNLGWPLAQTEWCIETLLKNGIKGIELAPLKVFDSWEEACNIDSVNKVNEYFQAQGVTISSFQAITFGAYDLALLGNEREKENLLLHLKKVARLLSQLGGEYAVFGSPSLRKDKNYSDSELTEVLTSINNVFSEHQVSFAFETVPNYYGCSVLNNLEQTENLLSKLGLSHVVRHFDTGCQYLSGDIVNEKLCDTFINKSSHIHISEVDLNNFSTPSSFNVSLAKRIKELYRGNWCVLEMGDRSFSKENFIRSVENFVSLFS